MFFYFKKYVLKKLKKNGKKYEQKKSIKLQQNYEFPYNPIYIHNQTNHTTILKRRQKSYLFKTPAWIILKRKSTFSKIKVKVTNYNIIPTYVPFYYTYLSTNVNVCVYL